MTERKYLTAGELRAETYYALGCISGYAAAAQVLLDPDGYNLHDRRDRKRLAEDLGDALGRIERQIEYLDDIFNELEDPDWEDES